MFILLAPVLLSGMSHDVFGDRAVPIASGMRPLSDPNEMLGMFLNAFTLLYLVVSVLVQLAVLCRLKGHAELNPAQAVE